MLIRFDGSLWWFGLLHNDGSLMSNVFIVGYGSLLVFGLLKNNGSLKLFRFIIIIGSLIRHVFIS